MSTIDPIEARRRREAARVGSPGALTGVIVGLLMIAVGAVLMVRALFAFGEFDAQGANAEADGPPTAIVWMVIGLPLLILGFLVHAGASRRFTGKVLSAPGVGPVSILFVGLAIGSWWGASTLAAAGASWLIPIGLSVVAATFLVLGAVTRVRRRSKRELLSHLLVHGRIQPGTIVAIPEIDPSSGGLVGTITVKFTDVTGTDRWVEQTGQWARRELPATGDPASVLYDPTDPADTSRIWLGPIGSTTSADFTRWQG